MMKFRYVDKVELWTRQQYYTGRKKGASVDVGIKNGRYTLFVNREIDGYYFNSEWKSHTNPEHQTRLDKLPDLKFEKLSDALEFVDKWVDENVLALEKKIK